MSKFFNALAVAVLGIALLMGAASAATTAGATVNGCLMPDTYFDLGDSLTDPADLGMLPATNVAGGSLTVTAGAAWAVTVAEDAGGDGKMANGAASLTNELAVNDVDLVNAAGAEIASDAATLCGPTDTVTISYDQAIDALDTTVGPYTISITYSLGADI